MPELPEVETVKNDLKPHLLNKIITGLKVILPKIIQQPVSYFRRLAVGQRIISLKRRAKIIVIYLNNGYALLIHLKMSGQLIFVSAKGSKSFGGHSIKGGTDELPNKYTHVIFRFSNGGHLYFNDLRQFGYLLIWPIQQLDDFFQSKKLGFEPFDKSLNFDKFRSALRKKKNSTIKAVLLSQMIIVGLGNIYTDETLFQARIRPSRRVKRLSLAEIKKIYQVIPKILKKAINKRGTTLRNFRGGLGQPGGMLKHLRVYGREGELCLRCKTVKIKRIRQGSRSSHYCPNCQR